jgi:hypothetical protein
MSVGRAKAHTACQPFADKPENTPVSTGVPSRLRV